MHYHLDTLIKGEPLAREEAAKCLDTLLLDPNPAVLGAFLALLEAKGVSANEFVGIVETMQRHMIEVQLAVPALDLVGTGGDGAGTVNLSTGAAILAAGLGVPIAKHGNRSVSSPSGSADFIENLGIDLSSKASMSVQEVGIGFFFAPRFHPVFKQVMPVRKQLGIRTVFNLLGPLLNPARVPYLIVGVANENLMPLFAETVTQLNHGRVLVVHGSGLDELSTLGVNRAILIEDQTVISLDIDPLDYGMKRCRLKDLQGESSKILEALEGRPGPISDTLILNAGVALWVAEKSSSIEEGIEKAREGHRDGVGMKKLNEWVRFYA